MKSEKSEANFAWLADDVHELIARENTLCMLAIT
jgi:hypothetical protein